MEINDFILTIESCNNYCLGYEMVQLCTRQIDHAFDIITIMKDYVKIIIEDDNKKVLEHRYLRVNEWGIPAGKIEANELPLHAAVRELLERTGYVVDPANLKEIKGEINSYVFKGKASNIIKVAEPGEKGGYSTTIRWI